MVAERWHCGRWAAKGRVGEGRGGKGRAGDGGGGSGEKRIGVFVLVLGLSGMQGGQGKEKCVFGRFLCI